MRISHFQIFFKSLIKLIIQITQLYKITLQFYYSKIKAIYVKTYINIKDYLTEIRKEKIKKICAIAQDVENMQLVYPKCSVSFQIVLWIINKQRKTVLIDSFAFSYKSIAFRNCSLQIIPISYFENKLTWRDPILSDTCTVDYFRKILQR